LRAPQRTGENGTSMVEFALVFILLISIMFGIMGFGHALYAYHFVNHAAKTAARWAAVNGQTCGDDGSCNGTNGMNSGPADETAIQNYVLALIPPGIDATKVTTAVSWPVQTGLIDPSPTICSTAVGGVGPYPKYQGCTVQVTVNYSFSFIFPLIRTTPISMSSTSDMIIAH
jgi:Flp pilus assembly protein TadG